MESTFSQMVKLFAVDGAGEAAEGIAFVAVDGAQQEDSTFTGRLAQEVTPVEAPDGMVASIAPAQQGAKTSLPQQASTVECSLGASNVSHVNFPAAAQSKFCLREVISFGIVLTY